MSDPAMQPAATSPAFDPLIELCPGLPILPAEAANRLLRQHGLSQALARAVLIDRVCSGVTLTEAEEQAAIREFLARQQVTSDEGLKQWLQQRRWTFDDLQAVATRQLRVLRHSEARFSGEVEPRFLDRKLELDQITYSLIRVADADLALELHQMIKEGEADFPELAPVHSSGPEARSRGVVGPISLAAAHPELMARLRVAEAGQLLEPFRVTDLWLVVRLEQRSPAQLDEAMRQRLLQDLFDQWLQQQADALMQGAPLTAH
jgi:parvulin-like peptidyl-prolyl isomerase